MAAHSGLVPFLVSLLGYILLGPFVLLILLLNEVIRLLASIYLELKYSGETWLVSDGNDGIWATVRPGRSRMVLTNVGYKGKVNRETLISLYNDKMRYDVDSDGNLAYSKLEYILVHKLGYPCWQQDRDFDIENHVRFLDDKVYSKQDLQELLKELSEDMDLTRPQWELVVVPRYKEKGNEGETGWMITRLNHAYMDGISVTMTIKRFMTTNFTFYLDPLNFRIPSWKRFLFYMNAVIYGPHTALYFLTTKLSELWPILPSSEVPIVERHYTWSSGMNMDYLRAIRNATDKASMQSIVQNAFISAAIQVLRGSRIPEKWRIGELAALLPYKDHRLQNRFTGFVYMVNSLEEDFTRLRNSKKAAWEGITGPFIPVLYAGFYLVGRMPVFLHPLLLHGTASTLFFSNVPTSKTKCYGVDNVEITELFAFPPQANDTGIALLCMTYANVIKVASSADSNWLRREELEEILGRIPGIIEGWAEKAEKIILLSGESPQRTNG